MNSPPRSFSDGKHVTGQWRTRNLVLSNPLLRGLCAYLSFKRAGVGKLSATAGPGALVADIGAGQGAYAHWLLAGTAGTTVVVLDWSAQALSLIPPPRRGRILRVCADAQQLPLKPECVDALFSIDTLGHLPSVHRALDEMLRVVKPDAPLFVHSECGSYRSRWPDTMLLRRIGEDFLSLYDGHCSVLTLETLRSLFSRRFHVTSVFCPAGLTGWLTGYPEKYRLAFRAAGLPLLATLTGIFALVKRLPFCGLLLRLVNASLNHLELALGLQGGGSFFVFCRKHARSSTTAGLDSQMPRQEQA